MSFVRIAGDLFWSWVKDLRHRDIQGTHQLRLKAFIRRDLRISCGNPVVWIGILGLGGFLYHRAFTSSLRDVTTFCIDFKPECMPHRAAHADSLGSYGRRAPRLFPYAILIGIGFTHWKRFGRRIFIVVILRRYGMNVLYHDWQKPPTEQGIQTIPVRSFQDWNGKKFFLPIFIEPPIKGAGTLILLFGYPVAYKSFAEQQPYVFALIRKDECHSVEIHNATMKPMATPSFSKSLLRA